MASSGEFNTVFDKLITIHFLGIQEGIALCCTVLIMMLLIWTCFSFKDQYYQNTSPILHKIKAFCFLTIISYLVMVITMAVLLNNFVIISHVACRSLYITYFSAYNIGNISSYLMMAFYIESLFPSHINKTVAIPMYCISIYRIFCIFIPSALWAMYLYLAFDHIKISEIDHYKYCYAAEFNQPFWAQTCLATIAFFHAAFIFFFLFAIASSAVNYTTLISRDIDIKTAVVIKNLSKIIRKATVLCIINVTSTAISLCLSAYILQQLIFCLVINGIINIYCIVCLLDVGDSFYMKTCAKIERICPCTYCIFDKYLYQNNIYTKQSKKVMKNNGNKKYKPPSIQDEVKQQQATYLRIEDVSFTKNININGTSITPFSGVHGGGGILPYSFSTTSNNSFNKFSKSKTSKFFGPPTKSSVTHNVGKSYSSIEMQSTI